MKEADIGYECMVCGGCGIVFYVPDHFYNDRLRSGEAWYCPNGHARRLKTPEKKSADIVSLVLVKKD